MFGRAGLVSIGALLVVAALLGGSSRGDAPQLIALRALAGLLIVPVIYFWPRRRSGGVGLPLILLALLAGWTALQLVPLPPGLWQALPGRETIAALDGALGAEGLWRPLSLAPGRTLNALLGLILPGAGLLMFAVFRPSHRTVLRIIVALGGAHALLGLLQMAGPDTGALYLYAITNPGYPVGFFANHNHAAVFSSLALLVTGYLAAETMRRSGGPQLSEYGPTALPVERITLLASFALILIAALVGGSRAGLLTAVFALVSTAAMHWLVIRNNPRVYRKSGPAKFAGLRAAASAIHPGIVIAGLGVLLIALFAMYDRVPALARLSAGGNVEDLRWDVLPVLAAMAWQYGLLGTGFGSFEAVYKIHEPASLALPTYLNQAHNDWLQLVIEGGFPAVALLAFLLVVAARRVLAMFGKSGDPVAGLFWFAVIAVIAVGSLFDYPLRAPLFQLVAVWLVALLLRSDESDIGPQR